MKTISLILISLLVMLSCNKPENRKSVTLTGHVYKKSDSTAYQNTTFIFYERSDATITGKKSEENIIPFTTNEQGFFKVSFEMLPKGDGLRVYWPDDHETIRRAIQDIDFRKDDINNLKIYAE